MKRGLIFRSFIYFLSISFLFLMNGFPPMVAGAKGKTLPLGEMVSKGTVQFETRENVWKNVESSHFPIFEGVKIKTDKGLAAIALSNGCHIEAGSNSLFHFDQKHQLHLSKGSIEFRIPSVSELNLKIGNISISKSRVLQASQIPLSTVPKNEETIGSISVHSNGAVTIKTVQGRISVLDENQRVLAALSSKESVTLPSQTIQTSPRMMTAQVGQTTTATTTTTGEFLGLSTWAWVGIALAAVVAVVVIAAAASGDDDHDRVAVCP